LHKYFGVADKMISQLTQRRKEERRKITMEVMYSDGSIIFARGLLVISH